MNISWPPAPAPTPTTPVVNNYFCDFAKVTAFKPHPAFTKIMFSTFSDPALFSNNEYIVSEDGQYLTALKIRVVDNSPSTSFGVGAFTSVVDGGHFSWDQTGNRQRHTINYIQLLPLTAGQTVKFFTYGDTALTIQTVAGFIYKI